MVVANLHLNLKRLKMKPLQQTLASKCLLLRDQEETLHKGCAMGHRSASWYPISSWTLSIFTGKACSYSDKWDNNITISNVYEPDVGWLLVRSREPLAQLWQRERDWKLKLRYFRTFFFFPAAAVTPPVLLSPGEFILSSQPNIMELTSFFLPWRPLTAALMPKSLHSTSACVLSMLLADTMACEQQKSSVTVYENLCLAVSPPFPVCHWVNNKMYWFTVVQMDWFIRGNNKLISSWPLVMDIKKPVVWRCCFLKESPFLRKSQSQAPSLLV